MRVLIPLVLCLATALVVWRIGTALRWGRPETYEPPPGTSPDSERWHTPGGTP